MRSRLRPAAGLLLLVALLTGCGSSDDGSDGEVAPIAEDFASDDPGAETAPADGY